jgi:hypothetical protein
MVLFLNFSAGSPRVSQRPHADPNMAPLPVKQTPDAPVIENVEERFRRLEATLTRDSI